MANNGLVGFVFLCRKRSPFLIERCLQDTMRSTRPSCPPKHIRVCSLIKFNQFSFVCGMSIAFLSCHKPANKTLGMKTYMKRCNSVRNNLIQLEIIGLDIEIVLGTFVYLITTENGLFFYINLSKHMKLSNK
ncbi:hypothetical protein V8G54_033000 [Vigna mungo]|uniref:Uncharacterized protein n=1 Tax=Vigna mungo TaxID=3915 RepID=A0AAQ3RIG2_VIGMU